MRWNVWRFLLLEYQTAEESESKIPERHLWHHDLKVLIKQIFFTLYPSHHACSHHLLLFWFVLFIYVSAYGTKQLWHILHLLLCQEIRSTLSYHTQETAHLQQQFVILAKHHHQQCLPVLDLYKFIFFLTFIRGSIQVFLDFIWFHAARVPIYLRIGKNNFATVYYF